MKKPLNFKVVKGGRIGDVGTPSKYLDAMESAVDHANEQDAARRRDKPTRTELLAAFDSGDLSETDHEHIRRILKDVAQPAGAPKESENAILARDGMLWFEYGKLLGKGLEKPAAKNRTATKYGVSPKTVEAAITRMHKLFRKE